MFPRWLSWLFVLFLGYVVVTGNRGITTQEAVPERAVRETRTEEEYPALHAFIDGERWKRAIYPTYSDDRPCAPQPSGEAMPSHAILETRGTGQGAQCGEALSLSVVQWDKRGAAAEPKDITLTLGEQPGLDALLVGMQRGEARSLVLRVPADGYKALPQLKGGDVAMLRVTRPSENK